MKHDVYPKKVAGKCVDMWKLQVYLKRFHGNQFGTEKELPFH